MEDLERLHALYDAGHLSEFWAEINRHLEALEAELGTVRSERRGLLGLVRARLEAHCPGGNKMGLLDLTNAAVERLAKCEAALRGLCESYNDCSGNSCVGDCVWCAARAALEPR